MVGIAEFWGYRPFKAGGKILLRSWVEVGVGLCGGCVVALLRCGTERCCHAFGRCIGGLKEHICSALLRYFPAAPAPVRGILVSPQAIRQHIHLSNGAPLAYPRTSRLNRHPYDIAHFPQFIIGVPGYPEIIHLVAFYHLLAIAPNAV